MPDVIDLIQDPCITDRFPWTLGAPQPCSDPGNLFVRSCLRRVWMQRSPQPFASNNDCDFLFTVQRQLVGGRPSSTWGTISNFFGADEIMPVTIEGFDERELPPWRIPTDTLFRRVHERAFAIPPGFHRGRQELINEICGPIIRNWRDRYAYPILRIVNKPGFILRTFWTVRHPRCVKLNYDGVGANFVLRWSLLHTYSDAYVAIGNDNLFAPPLNEDPCGFLTPNEDYCETRTTTFCIEVPIPFCDTVFDVWQFDSTDGFSATHKETLWPGWWPNGSGQFTFSGAWNATIDRAELDVEFIC